MNNMIVRIINENKKDLVIRKKRISPSVLKEGLKNISQGLNFAESFKNFGVIAEIKLASPSAGELEKSENIEVLAKEYEDGGADAISVVTEKYFFKGEPGYIKDVKRITGLPVLQKDFIFDGYQIYESKLAGADALLLIAKIISPDKLKKFVSICLETGIEPVVEINDKEDLKSALKTDTRIIAVNARDLDTFKIDIKSACFLLREIPDSYTKLGFSGINSVGEIIKYRTAGANGVLIGTMLIKSKNRKELLKEFKKNAS